MWEHGNFVAIGTERARTVIPEGGIACLMLEPGTRVSHRAVALAGMIGTQLRVHPRMKKNAQMISCYQFG